MDVCPELVLTLLAASLACSIRSLIFSMLLDMFLIGEDCEVRFSTSEILSIKDGMVVNMSFTGNGKKMASNKRKMQLLYLQFVQYFT